MSNGKRISAFATAAVMALSMAGCFSMTGVYATSDKTMWTEEEATTTTESSPVLEWVRIKDWNNDDSVNPSAITSPYDGHCMGYRVMNTGETFGIEIETNSEEIEPEVNISFSQNVAQADPELPIASVSDDGKILTIDNMGFGAWINVTATYNGKTVSAHGHLYANATEHNVTEGDGAKYDGKDLVQKIDAEKTKLRDVFICPANAYEDFVAKYGANEEDWSDEAVAEYDALLVACGTPVDSSNYKVTSGSTVIAFSSSWLDTLNVGTYDVHYTFTDGYAGATLVIPEKKNEVTIASTKPSSTTVKVANSGVMTVEGEGAKDALWKTIAGGMVVAMVAFAAITINRKKKI